MSSPPPSPAQTLDRPLAPHQHPTPKRRWPLRWLLPYSEILLCFALLFPYRAYIVFDLFHLNLSSGDPIPGLHRNPDGTPSLDMNEFQRWSRASDSAFDLVSALNLPGMMFELPYAILSAEHQSWRPGRVNLKLWRAVTWPLLALPFWWMAGRGLEALIAARRKLVEPRIGWFAALISFLLVAGGPTIAIGIFFFSGADSADRLLRLFSAACLVWAILGSFCVLAKIAQWRISKRALAITPPHAP